MGAMEWIGLITGAICVYLIVIEKDVNWPIGVVNSAILCYVFWGYGLYSQVVLQILYILEGFYGWYMWTRRDKTTGLKLIRIGRSNRATAFWMTGLGALGTLGFWWAFKGTDDPAPFWDALITSASLVGEYLLCLKLTEGWFVYFASDLVALVLFALLGQWITFATYLCFTFLCAMGIREWFKRMRSMQQVSVPKPAFTS